MPVEAPLGTAARKRAIGVQRSTSTVGLPLESKISLARTWRIWKAPPAGASSRAATPGSTLPSKSSREAPPPVEQWVTLSSVSYFLQAVAVSPPPMTVTAPDLVTSTILSIITLVPVSKAAISKTPMGPFQTMVLLLAIVAEFKALLSGPQSRPMKPSGMPSSLVTPSLISPSSPNLEEQVKSTGRMISTPSFSALARISGTILAPSSSYREVPIDMLSLIFKKV
mmetsp:Transcript_50371/g.104887  ORF Transcript_50371/g.104887 Transcript_50371/m.104887 type:complete len:225 (-) Transcript_50371:773-1447(-)